MKIMEGFYLEKAVHAMRLDTGSTNTIKSNHQVGMAIFGSFQFRFQSLGRADYHPLYQKTPIVHLAAHAQNDRKVSNFHSRTIPHCLCQRSFCMLP